MSQRFFFLMSGLICSFFFGFRWVHFWLRLSQPWCPAGFFLLPEFRSYCFLSLQPFAAYFVGNDYTSLSAFKRSFFWSKSDHSRTSISVVRWEKPHKKAKLKICPAFSPISLFSAWNWALEVSCSSKFHYTHRSVSKAALGQHWLNHNSKH